MNHLHHSLEQLSDLLAAPPRPACRRQELICTQFRFVRGIFLVA
jgi:hypothetical protein